MYKLSRLHSFTWSVFFCRVPIWTRSKTNSKNFFVKILQNNTCQVLTFNLIFGRWGLNAERRLAYSGKMFRIAFARDREGAYPAEEFFDHLSKADQVKLDNLFRILGDHGKIPIKRNSAILVTGFMNSSHSKSGCRLPMQKPRGV